MRETDIEAYLNTNERTKIRLADEKHPFTHTLEVVNTLKDKTITKSTYLNVWISISNN